MRNNVLEMISSLASDPPIFVLLGDLGVYQCREMFNKNPDRIINYGIMEQSMVGVAAGLASSGYYPIVYSITPFLVDRCFEQIKIDLIYNMNSSLIISAGASFDYSKLGPTHFCPHDISALLLLGMPNLFIPCNISDSLECVRYAVSSQSLAYLRLSNTILDIGKMFQGYKLFPISSSLPNVNAVKLWKKPELSNTASLIFTPDSQFLPSFGALATNGDVFEIIEVSCLSFDLLKSSMLTYTKIQLFMPFACSALVEKMFFYNVFPSSCLISVHTISHTYIDYSSTKESIIRGSYLSYSFVS